MTGWLVRRFAQMLLVVFGVVTLAFVFAYLVPANPARMVAGPQASPQAVASIARQLGLDRSVWSQYVSFLGRLLHGNLGVSFALEGRTVAGEIWGALPYTAVLALGGVLWEIVLGIPVGIIAAYQSQERRRPLRHPRRALRPLRTAVLARADADLLPRLQGLALSRSTGSATPSSGT